MAGAARGGAQRSFAPGRRRPSLSAWPRGVCARLRQGALSLGHSAETPAPLLPDKGEPRWPPDEEWEPREGSTPEPSKIDDSLPLEPACARPAGTRTGAPARPGYRRVQSTRDWAAGRAGLETTSPARAERERQKGGGRQIGGGPTAAAL